MDSASLLNKGYEINPSYAGSQRLANGWMEVMRFQIVYFLRCHFAAQYRHIHLSIDTDGAPLKIDYQICTLLRPPIYAYRDPFVSASKITLSEPLLATKPIKEPKTPDLRYCLNHSSSTINPTIKYFNIYGAIERKSASIRVFCVCILYNRFSWIICGIM